MSRILIVEGDPAILCVLKDAAPLEHVVIRVDPGGGQYHAFVLENHDEHDLVIATLGPFAASGRIPSANAPNRR